MSAVLADPQVLPRVVRLSTAVEVNPKIDRTGLTDETQVSFVPMAAVGAASGHIDVSTVRPYAEVKKGYTNFRNGDVLFAKVTPCMENGKMAVARQLKSGVGFGSTEFHVLRPREGIDSQYIYYFVSSQTFRKEASGHMTGAVGLRRVPSAFLENAEVPLPPLERQREIVAELEKQFSRLDEAVANLQRVKANLKRYKASILKAAVEGRIVETEASIAHREGRGGETGEQLLQRVLTARRAQWVGRGKYKEPDHAKQAKAFALPDGWSWGTLDQLHLQIADVDHKMPKAVDVGIPYVSTKDFFGDEGIDFATAKRISTEDFNALSRKVRLENGDILLSRYGTVGEVQLVTTDDPFQASYSVAILKPVRGLIPVSFLASVLRSDVVMSQIKRDVRATAQPDLGLAHIRLFVIPLPPVPEQIRIVAAVDRHLSIVREVEAEVDTNLKRAQALRQATLAKAFCGDGKHI